MLAFFQVLQFLADNGLIDPKKDRWDKPEEWELNKRLSFGEDVVKTQWWIKARKSFIKILEACE